MAKERKYRHADYEATEKTQIALGEALPEEHLARFIVNVVALLDLSDIYGGYSERGGMPYASVDLLAAIVTTNIWHSCGFDTLAIKAARRWVFVSSLLASYFGSEGVVDPLPGAVVTPCSESRCTHFAILGILWAASAIGCRPRQCTGWH